ncbi:MAG: NAD(P)/FAD-dependent oxidoreductase [Propionibacteriaceae bacterium]
MIDILVVGGGPVGLAAALNAARLGLSVLVCEARAGPIDKACGEGLLPGTLAALHALDVDPPGHRLTGIRYVCGETVAEADFRLANGRGVPRTQLHQSLIAAVNRAGVEIITTTALPIDQDDHGVTTELGGTGSRPLRSRYLLAADGLHSPIRHRLGLDRRPSRTRRFGLRRHYTCTPWSDKVEVHWAEDREAYVTPLGPDTVGIAVLTTNREPFDRHLEHFPALRDRLAHAETHHRVRGAGPLRQAASARVAGRILLVGDAAGYVDALTGEGLGIGLAQARSAVASITAGVPERYGRSPAVGWRSTMLTHALLRAAQRPAVRRHIVPAARRWPGLFSTAVDELARPL